MDTSEVPFFYPKGETEGGIKFHLFKDSANYPLLPTDAEQICPLGWPKSYGDQVLSGVNRVDLRGFST